MTGSTGADNRMPHRRRLLLLLGGLGLLVLAGLVGAGARMFWMPGHSASWPVPTLTEREVVLAEQLEKDVRALSQDIGPRHMGRPRSLQAAREHIESRLTQSGYEPDHHTYTLDGAGAPRFAGEEGVSVVAELPGTQRPDEIVIIGAHYDTVPGSPGANDNASGVAVLLALAERFRERPQPRTVRFIAFTNEEPPFYKTDDMGSFAYAREARQRGDNIVAMVSLDGVGYYSDAPGSQGYPLPGLNLFYPDRGHFIGFVTRVRDAALLRRALGAFREQADLPSQGAALPGWLAVDRSDHWAFWQHGYSAMLVTDTLPFRDPQYHEPGDTAERLDYEAMMHLVEGLTHVLKTLAE